MSLKTIVDGIGETLANAVDTDTPDGADLRGPVLAAIDRAARQWADRDAQGAWFSADNGSVAFSPTLDNGAPLTIDGQTRVFVPADRFADYLDAMRTAVERGEFDAEIKGGLTGSPNVSGLAKVPMPDAPARRDD